MATLTPPPPSRPRRRQNWPGLSRNRETRSVQIGILATIVVHLLLLLALPHFLNYEGVPLSGVEPDKTFNVELVPEEPKAPEPTPPPKPFKFVEVNPDAPDNPPDKTDNFGAQNQQVAQEKPTPDGKSDAPAIEGDKEKQSTAIVSGHLEKIEPRAPPTPPTPEEQQATEAVSESSPKVAKSPLSGFEKNEGDNQDSAGSNVAKLPPPNTQRAPEAAEGETNVREIVSFNGQVVRIDPKRPQNRDKVPQRNTRPAFLKDNPLGTQNIGPVAYNAKWSEFGEYMQRLIETVQIQWERLIVQSSVYPPAGTMVSVKFRINEEGKITEISPDDGSAPLVAKRTCVSAITARAPYGAWTQEMIAVLGHDQDMTFTFYYNP